MGAYCSGGRGLKAGTPRTARLRTPGVSLADSEARTGSRSPREVRGSWDVPLAQPSPAGFSHCASSQAAPLSRMVRWARGGEQPCAHPRER